MTRAARSIYVFGIYLIAVGGILIGAPNTLLALIRVPPTTEPWIHILGVVVMAMGMLHVASARGEQTAFMRASARVRVFVLTAFVVFVLLKIAPPVIILFGIADIAFAAWTFTALRDQSQVMTERASPA
jgi:hypothetical protein